MVTDCLPGEPGYEPSESSAAHQFFNTPASAVTSILPYMLPHGWRGERVLDLGAGDGGLLLPLLDYGVPREAITAVEVRPQCLDRLTRVAGHVVIADALTWAPDARYDLVITNPPGRKALAFAQAAYGLLSPRGEAWVLALLGFAAGSSRIAYHRRKRPDVYVCAQRPQFIEGRSNNTDWAWYCSPGRGRWQQIELGAPCEVA